jgi:uncharacterized membrane protein YkoI
MQFNRKTVAASAVAAALAAGGVGAAIAIGGGDGEGEERVTGTDAAEAEAAALDAVGGGTVLESEYQESGGEGAYEVEVQRPDGTQVEVYVDANFDVVGQAEDDESGSEDEAGDDED